MRRCQLSRTLKTRTLHHLSSRSYGIQELEARFGRDNFKKIQNLDLETATPLERKMHVFITRIQKSPTLNDTITLYDTEVIPQPEGMGENISKPNMQKIVQSAYNWNPYHGRNTKKDSNKQHDHLDAIPEEYKQAGWGMQPAPVTGSPQIHKMFPNTDILKNMINDGQRVFEMGHLLNNPLRDLGYRDANIAEGRDYNVLERVLQPFSSNVVEEWHGIAPIESQQEKEPPSLSNDCELSVAEMALTQKQIVMRRLKKRAESAWKENASLPPFKFGFEDVPVFVKQRNYHSPDKLGDPKRTRELPVKAHIYLKHAFPNMSKWHKIACKLIGTKYYDPKTTKLQLMCTNHYFYDLNEKQVMEWIGKLLVEIDRLAECFSTHSRERMDNMKWEDYKAIYETEWAQDRIYRFVDAQKRK